VIVKPHIIKVKGKEREDPPNYTSAQIIYSDKSGKFTIWNSRPNGMAGQVRITIEKLIGR